jgi:hypothetical protein
VPADTDNSLDLYVRSPSGTTLISHGANNDAGPFYPTFDAISDDGSRVVFSTSKRLAPTDTDDNVDIYEWSNGTITQVSIGSINGNTAVCTPPRSDPVDCPAWFDSSRSSSERRLGASADGKTVLFWTNEALVSADTDSSGDVYQWSDGVTSLVSQGDTSGVNGVPYDGPAYPGGLTRDGSVAFFQTGEDLSTTDHDGGLRDVYRRYQGVTTQVSQSAYNGNSPDSVDLMGFSDDGSHVYLQTSARLAPTDTDDVYDVYEVFNGVLRQVSVGEIPGSGNDLGGYAWYENASSDGSSVFFQGLGHLTEDQHGPEDLYRRSGGHTSWVPGAGFTFAVTNDGSGVYFWTNEALVPEDTNGGLDIYEAVGDQQILVSAPDSISPPGPYVPPDPPVPPTPPDNPQGGIAGDVKASPGVNVQTLRMPRTWRKLIEPGVRVLASCDSDCRIDVTVSISTGIARKAGLHSAVVARGDAQAAGGELRWISAKAVGSARRAFQSFGGRARLHVSVSASQSA